MSSEFKFDVGETVRVKAPLSPHKGKTGAVKARWKLSGSETLKYSVQIEDKQVTFIQGGLEKV
jgi:hypothetical protein